MASMTRIGPSAKSHVSSVWEVGLVESNGAWLQENELYSRIKASQAYLDSPTCIQSPINETLSLDLLTASEEGGLREA